MQTRTRIKSAALLIVLLFSFSLGAYATLNNFCHAGYFSIKKIRVDIPRENNCSNDILSEELENENDNDDFSAEAFFLLPFSGLSLDVFCIKFPAPRLITVQDTPESIWLSIRVFRI